MPPGDKPSGRPATRSLARGASIGRYVVLGLVGKGGMGEVYAAYDPELDRKVAVKLLRSQPTGGVSQSEGRARILREAQAIAKLSHPNVVVVYDVGTFQDQVFIAMEFLEGNTLGHWIHARERTWQEVLRVFLAAGRGLQAAHEKALVHRDFKPDNVMVDKEGQVRVMDFGLARQVNEKTGDAGKKTPTPVPTSTPSAAGTVAAVGTATSSKPPVWVFTEDGQEIHADDTLPAGDPVPASDAQDLMLTNVISPQRFPPDDDDGKPVDILRHQTSSAFEAQLTRTGSMMGTPAYMSPEQFLGKFTDERTDQFSFCVALYEGLYGERPFAGKTLFGLTSNVVQGQISDAPANTKVPAWLRKILLRGLKSDARQRYASMKELLAALEKDPAAARRKVVLVAAAMVLPLVVGIGVRQSMQAQKSMCAGGPEKLTGIWELEGPRQAETARKAAIHQAMRATGKSYAEKIYGNVSRVLNAYVRAWADMYRETCERTNVRGDQSAEVLDLRMSCLGERLERVRALTQVFAQATGETVENALGAVHALPTLERCADIPLLRAVVKPPDDPGTRIKVNSLRHRLAEVKALDDAGSWTHALMKGSDLAREARALKYLPILAEVLNVLGLLQHRLGDAQTAEQTLEEAFWAAEMSQHDDIKAEAAINQVWVVGYTQERYNDAERWGHHAEAVLQRLKGHERLRAWLLNNLGSVYEARGQSVEALKALKESLALKERVLPSDHPDIAVSLGNTASYLQALDRNQEALGYNGRAMAILERGVGAEHPEFATQLSNRGEILRALRQPQQARVAFRRALAIWEKELGSNHPNLAYALTGIGESYLDEDNALNAVGPLEKAFAIREEKERGTTVRAETRFALARALWQIQRDPKRARALAEEARAAYRDGGLSKKLSAVTAWMEAVSLTRPAAVSSSVFSN